MSQFWKQILENWFVVSDFLFREGKCIFKSVDAFWEAGPEPSKWRVTRWNSKKTGKKERTEVGEYLASWKLEHLKHVLK